MLVQIQIQHPKHAGLSQKILIENDTQEIVINPTHQHNYQIQGQMALTGVESAILILFTDNGLYEITIPVDKEMWKKMSKSLCTFYHETFFFQIAKLCSMCTL